MPEKQRITVSELVLLPVQKVWELWTQADHIIQWNQASADWHTPKASVDLREGGLFSSTMAAKDGSFSFDFTGTYTVVKPPYLLEYTMSDGRSCKITFVQQEVGTLITETFEAENENSLEMQEAGWKAILISFRTYAEGLSMD